jgi:chemotaxis protein CheC
MSTQEYTELQLDALRELANIGSGTAGTALAGLLGRSVDLSVPKAAAMSLEDAVDVTGSLEAEVGAVLVPIMGDLDAVALLLFPPADADAICGLLGVDAQSEDGASALGEIGNILCASYINALGTMLGMELEPRPPQVAWDMLGAIVASVLLREAKPDGALVLDSNLIVEGESCSLSFLLLPTQGGIADLLGRMGV